MLNHGHTTILYSLFFFWALKFPYEAWSIVELKFITIYFYIYVSLAYIFSFQVAHLILFFSLLLHAVKDS